VDLVFIDRPDTAAAAAGSWGTVPCRPVILVLPRRRTLD
jgi:hypothetical protein